MVARTGDRAAAAGGFDALEDAGRGGMTAPVRADARVPALDGLRGVASLIVLIAHVWNALFIPLATRSAVTHSPVALLLSSSGAVQLFFVLSGYVLSASVERARSGGAGGVGVARFVAKRILRIHPPYVCAVLFAWGASFYYVAPPGGLGQGLSPMLAGIHLSPGELASTFFFPGSARLQLPVGWTLTVEMIFSLGMPLMVWVALRAHWLVLVAASLGLMVGLEVGHPLRYAIDFSVGIAAYQERDRIAAWLAASTGLLRAGLVAAGLCLFSLPHATGSDVVNGTYITNASSGNLVMLAVGSVLLVVGAVHVRSFQRALSTVPMLWLGKISFSLYLVHYTVILLVSPWIARPTGVVDAVAAYAMVASLSFAGAALGARLVERPSIRLGALAAARIGA